MRPSMASTAPATPSPSSGMKVLVRCRGRNDRETTENSSVVVKTSGHKGREITVEGGPVAHTGKTYTFDRVFGPESDQRMIFEAVGSSLDEMLQGYNCTIFAYGQTGTGKTYTMTGDFRLDEHGEAAANAGIVPRALVELFKRLSGSAGEHSVKLSYIELYNEELRDLLSNNNQGNSDARKLRIFEDAGKKGTVVQGLEEAYVRTCPEAMAVLQEGFTRRQVAATKCNDMSSRSHSVLTITLSTKELTVDGQEYLRTGKLNLVDLAGSENVGRSGAENMRAREAGSINQSLLTLGRVINSLVDGTPHIPYRESKLTRLLQESLGGRTKTVIIATVSPARVSIDETISTLEYSHRAKNIKNSPVVNETTSKQVFIKDYVDEIARLRADLDSTRKGQGVFLSQESYQLLLDENQSHKVTIGEQKMRLEVLEERAGGYEGKMRELEEQHGVLVKGGKRLLSALDGVVADVQKLHEFGGAVKEIGDSNEMVTRHMVESAPKRLKICVDNHADDVASYISRTTEGLSSLENFQKLNGKFLNDLEKQLDDSVSSIQSHITRLVDSNHQDNLAMTTPLSSVAAVKTDMKDKISESMGCIKSSISDYCSDVGNHTDSYKAYVAETLTKVQSSLKRSVAETKELYEQLQNQLNEQVSKHISTTSGSTASIQSTLKAAGVAAEQQKKRQSMVETELKQRVSAMIEEAMRQQGEQWGAVVGGMMQNVSTHVYQLDAATDSFGRDFKNSQTVEWSGLEFQEATVEEHSRSLQESVSELSCRQRSGQQTLDAVVDSRVKSVSSCMTSLDSFVVQATSMNDSLSKGRKKRMTQMSQEFESGLSTVAQSVHVYSDESALESSRVKDELSHSMSTVTDCVDRLGQQVGSVASDIESHVYHQLPSAPAKRSYEQVGAEFRAVVDKGSKSHRDPLHEVVNEL